MGCSSVGNSLKNTESSEMLTQNEKELVSKLKLFKKEQALKFKQLKVKKLGGEIVNIESLSDEVFVKIFSHKIVHNLDTSALLLSMLTNPEHYQATPLIRVDNPEIYQKFSLTVEKKYLKMSDFFDKNNQYILAKDLMDAVKKDAKKRTAYEKELLLVDDRIALVYSIFTGEIFEIYPNPSNGKEWKSPKSAIEKFPKKESQMIKLMTLYLFEGASNMLNGKGSQKFDKALELINLYQKKYRS